MSCAVNITGLKYITEAVDYQVVVGERSNSDEGVPARYAGVVGSENADMSSDKGDENTPRRKPKGSYPRTIRVGLVGP